MTPKLTTNYSASLATLLRAGEAPVDGIEVGPWLSPAQVSDVHQAFPALPIQFHVGSFITRYRYRPGALDGLAAYHACTQSAWVSLHLELLPVWVYWSGARLGLYLPPPATERVSHGFVDKLLQLKDALELPILLENLASLPREKYAYAADPDVIGEIVQASGSGLLLDIAHARIAASYQGMAVEAYLQKLPLERVEQIHVSGPRVKGGYLRDAHDTLQEEDYALLGWALARCTPKVVTLEYFRQQEPLREQLGRLRGMVGGGCSRSWVGH